MPPINPDINPTIGPSISIDKPAAIPKAPAKAATPRVDISPKTKESIADTTPITKPKDT